MKIKICGIKRPEDVSYVNLFQPDFAGFILASGYRRTVLIEDAKFFIAKMDKNIKKVGVFVNQPLDMVAEIAKYTGIDIIQLHGNEDNDYIDKLRTKTDKQIWNVFKVKDVEEIKKAEKSNADMILLDTYSPDADGGTGKKVNLEIVSKANLSRDFILAGGLDSSNIEEAVKSVNPYAVDISSGVETDGIKDAGKIADIIKKIREI
jgi:phosphoribosylanthranilate isomerase